MFDLGAGELLLIVFVVLILFGPKKLPELAQSLGRGMREFKRAQREFTEQINQAVSDDHYRKQRGPELQSPEGSVARGASRRSVANDAPAAGALAGDASSADVPPGETPTADADHPSPVLTSADNLASDASTPAAPTAESDVSTSSAPESASSVPPPIDHSARPQG